MKKKKKKTFKMEIESGLQMPVKQYEIPKTKKKVYK